MRTCMQECPLHVQHICFENGQAKGFKMYMFLRIYTPNSRPKPKPKCHGRIEFIHYYALLSARMPAMDGAISKTEVVSTVFRSVSL